MPTKTNYEDHTWVLQRLKDAQESEKDMRDWAREAIEFLSHPQGQWEDFWWEANDERPRYTFDLVTPHVDQVHGPVQRSDFGINVEPAGGSASQDIAEVYAGLIRNIQNISKASHIFNRTGRRVIVCGLGGWRLKTRYAEGDSFDQDLFIENIPNFVDRVWFGPHEEPDASDAEYGFVLTGMSEDEYKADYPDAQRADVESDRSHHAYYHRDDLVMVGEFIYLEEVERELLLMSDGRVLDKEEVGPVLDELALEGVTVARERTRKVKKVKSRMFSASGWLGDPRETVFENWLPVIPCYGNFDLSDDKRVYFGAVQKQMDAQRVYNYAQSRQVEEVALAPRAKWLVTEKQIEGLEEEWDSLNVDASPYLVYKPDEMAQAPTQSGGAQVNPGVKVVTDDMAAVIRTISGHFDATMGDNPNDQSGEAIKALQDRGDTGTNKYLEAMEISQEHTARILIDAIPRVYLPRRQVRVIGEDNVRETVTLGQVQVDSQTQQDYVVIDLAQGTYDVTVSAGPSYKNRQNETVSVLKELGMADPTIAEIGGDIMAANVTSPGMKDIAERKRRQLFVAGVIPESQMTDLEKQELAAMQEQPPAEDPNMVLARAEEGKALADQMEVQLNAQKHADETALKNRELSIKERELAISEGELQIKAAEAGVELESKRAKARKDNADAEAQEIENFATTSGVTEVLEAANAAAGGQL